MKDLRPNFDDISLSYDIFLDPHLVCLSDAAFRALMRLIEISAAGKVWTYTPPGDGGLPDDDTLLARITCRSPRQWKKIRPSLERYFESRDGQWFLKSDWIHVRGNAKAREASRPAIPAGLRSLVLQRDNYRCAYCGGTDGPFHCDHIIPDSRGGATCAENLITACGPCNISKSDRTIEEWIRERTLGVILKRVGV